MGERRRVRVTKLVAVVGERDHSFVAESRALLGVYYDAVHDSGFSQIHQLLL